MKLDNRVLDVIEMQRQFALVLILHLSIVAKNSGFTGAQLGYVQNLDDGENGNIWTK